MVLNNTFYTLLSWRSLLTRRGLLHWAKYIHHALGSSFTEQSGRYFRNLCIFSIAWRPLRQPTICPYCHCTKKGKRLYICFNVIFKLVKVIIKLNHSELTSYSDKGTSSKCKSQTILGCKRDLRGCSDRLRLTWAWALTGDSKKLCDLNFTPTWDKAT